MPFKRPALPHDPSSGYSSGSRSEPPTPDVYPPSKRSKVAKSAKVFSDVKVHIVQAKIDGASLVELFNLAERHCERLCADVEDADVVITAITMRRRFERHVPWDVAVRSFSCIIAECRRLIAWQKTKAIVTPAWLRDSVAEEKPLSCAPYVALQDLREETIQNCPTCDKVPCECEDTDIEAEPPGPEVHYPSPPASSGSAPSSPTLPSMQRQLKHASEPESSSNSLPLKSKPVEVEEVSAVSDPIPEHLLPPVPPIPTDLKRLDYSSKYACRRASPLVCPNQALVLELDIIKRSRALEGEDRSALSYSRAISVIKGIV